VRTSLWAGLVAVDLLLDNTQANPSRVTLPVTRQDKQLVVVLLMLGFRSGIRELLHYLL